MVELLFLCTLSRGMKDVFILPRGLGLRGVEQKIKNVTFLNPLIYLVYYGFHYPSTPKIDIHPKYPEHNSDVSELVPALQDKGVFSDHQYLQQYHNMHYF